MVVRAAWAAAALRLRSVAKCRVWCGMEPRGGLRDALEER